MNLTDRIVEWNARSWSIPLILLKGVVGWFVAGILLAVLVPALRARGMPMSGWMVWVVILMSIAACVGPDLYRRYRRRDSR